MIVEAGAFQIRRRAEERPFCIILTRPLLLEILTQGEVKYNTR